MPAVSLPENSSEATQPTRSPSARGPWRILRWFILLVVTAVLFAALVGYASGQRQRQSQVQVSLARAADEQFQLGLQDLQAARFELARQRPNTSSSSTCPIPTQQRLAEALVGLDAPVATFAPAATPTPNLAPVQDLLSQASAAHLSGDWDVVIDTLLALRAKDAEFHAVEVDGMLYSALRNRGLKRIKSEGLLEEGLYDMSLAERFAPLDSEAEEYRGWAKLYLLANSFFGVNWAEAVYYFAQIYLSAPYITNDVYLKYAVASNRYGDEFIVADDPCSAEELYYQSLLAWENPDLVPTATKAHKMCEDGQRPPPAPAETATPAAGETPTPAEAPSNTPES
jgi:hypothetical protein